MTPREQELREVLKVLRACEALDTRITPFVANGLQDAADLIEQQAQTIERLRAALEKAEDHAEYWSLVADGIKHSHLCPNNALCSPADREHGTICDRCRAEAADLIEQQQAQTITTLREALRGVYVLPRPWIDGGVTWKEWDVAFTAIEAALATVSRPEEAETP